VHELPEQPPDEPAPDADAPPARAEMRRIITRDVGFVCRYEPDYVNAIRCVDQISPETCREKAMRDFHYVRMARDYVAEYEKEIATKRHKRLRI
jgi:hypothetical protein